MYEPGLTALGVTLLSQQLKMAAKMFSAMTLAKDAPAIQESMAFVKGSGLETALEVFALPYSADRLRETFFEFGQRRQPVSASS